MKIKYNIGLEISTIGLSNLNSERGYNKTGIYRVTAELTEALLLREDLNIFPIFWEHPYTTEFGMEYFLNKGICPNDIKQISHYEKIIYRTICNCEKIAKRHVIANIISKAIQHFRHFNSFEKIHIYHSLYYPNPTIEINKNKIMMRTIHDLIPLKYPQYFSKRHRDRFFYSINKIDTDRDYIFAVSEATKNDVCEYFKINEDRVFVNHLAASKKSFYPDTKKDNYASLKKKIGIPDSGYFLSVATLEPRKNLTTVLKAFLFMIKEKLIDSDTKLILVGKRGWMIDEFLSKVGKEEFSGKKNVVITGFLSDDELRILYSNTIAFLFISFYEGFGLPVLEAMQCGAPVVASNRSSLPEIVGNAGILVNPVEVYEVCNAMKKLYDEHDTRMEYIKRGLERAALFSWSKTGERTVDGYMTAIRDRAMD